MRVTVKWLVFALLALAFALLAGTFLPRPLITGSNLQATRTIMVIANPIHSDIVIPLDEDVRKMLQPIIGADLLAQFADRGNLVIGWGGRSFYLETPRWSDLKARPLLRAFTLDRSVLHMDSIDDAVLARIAAQHLSVNDQGFANLLSFLAQSFDRDETGRAREQLAGYGPGDRFFAATGYFNAFAGCNTWTSAALRAAGLRTGWWNPMPQSLQLSLRLFN